MTKNSNGDHWSSKNSTSELLIFAASILLVGHPSYTVAKDLLFQPSDVTSSFSSKNTEKFVDSLNNDRLAEQARLMRSTEMSATHRALNHQWLAVHSGKAKRIKGNKIFSKLAKKTFKQYLKNKRNKNKIGNITLFEEKTDDIVTNVKLNDINYDLRLSDDSVKFKFEYEFH